MMDDATLLDRYARERSEAAFGELVQRHLTLVYSAALRRTDGDAHRAQDVAQIVFTALARDAAALSRHPALTGWLYTATRNAAIDLMRSERRRRIREEKAHTMDEILSPETPRDWEQLRLVLDEAMDELEDRDREAVLLRFFEGQPFAGVAGALRVSEEAARKRVDRALEKLGGLLARRGITSTGGALAVLLANQTAVAAPAGVAATITAAAVAGAGAGASAGAVGLFIMSTSKVVTGITAVVALAAVGSAVYEAKLAHESAAAVTAIAGERDTLRSRNAALEQRARQSADHLAAVQTELDALQAAAAKSAATAATAAKAAVPSAGAAVDYVLDHPETHAAFVEQQVLQARAHYARFLKTAGLSPAQETEFFKQIRERGAAELDFMLALRAQGYGVGNLPKDPQVQAGFQKMATEQKTNFETGLRAVLGADGYKSFQQYSATLPERNVVDQLGGQLYLSETPLTAQQADQLTQILVQNRFSGQPTPSPSTTQNGTFLTRQAFLGALGQATQQNGLTLLDWHAPVTDAALTRAESVLTPAQLAVLRQVQAQQAAQFQIVPPPPSPQGARK